MSYHWKPTLGSRVCLTPEGASAHRSYHQNKNRLFGVALGAIALPAIIPSAGIGIAGGGFALGVDELSQGAVGGFIGGLLGGEFSSSAEGGITGKVLQVQERGFWQEGWDVEVRWKLKKDGKNIQHEAWHEAKHLTLAPTSHK